MLKGNYMELTILGNNGTCPIEAGACSSYLVRTLSQKILIDMGNGSVANLQHYCDLKDIDIIIISHLHFDHFADLIPMKYALETRKCLGERIPMIDLYIPPMPQWLSEELSTNDVFNIQIIAEDIKVHKGNISISWRKVRHSIASFAVRVEAGDSSFVYSSDTGECAELIEIARNADTFLCESTFTGSGQDARQSHHLSAYGAARTAEAADVGKLLLTHFSEPSYPEVYTMQAREIFPHVVATHMHQTYPIAPSSRS